MAGPERVALAVHRQWVRDQLFDTAPLHASAAMPARRRSTSGPTRRAGSGPVQTATALADRSCRRCRPGSAERSVPAPRGADRLQHRPGHDPAAELRRRAQRPFDPATVAGKSVLIGAAAIELGDWRSVPHYRALPGAAAAGAGVRDHRASAPPLSRPGLAVSAAQRCCCRRPGFGRLPWRRGAGLLCGSAALIPVSAIGPPAFDAVAVDTSAAARPGARVQRRHAGRVERQARALVGQIGALPAKDDMMRQLVDSSFDAIVTFGDDGKVLSCNRAAERIFGAPAPTSSAARSRPLPDQATAFAQTLAQAGGIHELRRRARRRATFPGRGHLQPHPRSTRNGSASRSCATSPSARRSRPSSSAWPCTTR